MIAMAITIMLFFALAVGLIILWGILGASDPERDAKERKAKKEAEAAKTAAKGSNPITSVAPPAGEAEPPGATE